MAWHPAFRYFPYPFPEIPGFEGESILDVIFGHGHTIWKSADASAPDAGGWQTVLVDPDVVAARVAGLSFGFCLWDEVGTTWLHGLAAVRPVMAQGSGPVGRV
ncbi:MAG: hypothetical protein LC660_17775 [Desulfobacteraceae bacterium]|nr:hypothetical protein [Desulfobacteraceae bacterium]